MSAAPLSALDRQLAAALASALVTELRTELSPTVINDERPARLTLAAGQCLSGRDAEVRP